MLYEVVIAPSVNCFKRHFDKYWKILMYETDEDMFTTAIAYGRWKYCSDNGLFGLSLRTEEEDDDDDDDESKEVERD